MIRWLNIILLLLTVLLACGNVMAEPGRTGQRTCYDMDGNVIDFAECGQDGDIQAGVVWPKPRFTNNDDGTVTDHLTGLMWIDDGSCLGDMTWPAAMAMVRRFNFNGEEKVCAGLSVDYDDWSLPEIRELESLFNSEEPFGNEWLQRNWFKGVEPDGYWAVSPTLNPYSAWIMNFDTGEVLKQSKVKYYHTLLVRRLEPGPGRPVSDNGRADDAVRFVDNGDGTVTDLESGLMWLKDANCLAEESWEDAMLQVDTFNVDPDYFACADLAVHYQDWALPNRNELRSIVDHYTELPAIPIDFPVDGVEPLYWTSTTVPGYPSKAYDVHMGWGDMRMGDKVLSRYIWPVRPVAGRPERERIAGSEEAPMVVQEHFFLNPADEFIEINWPINRFTDHGDGTVSDNLTGLMWLKDGACFGKQRWQDGFRSVNGLSRNPSGFDCVDYTADYDDWELPEFGTMHDLIKAVDQEPASWLNDQDVVNVKARDYWTMKENPYNLYYAWGMNLRQGTPRNYPKSFPLYVWPVRVSKATKPVVPEVVIMANGNSEGILLEKGQQFSLSVAVDKVAASVPARYSIWYEAPDGSLRWLSAKGQWREDEQVLYKGNLFELARHQVFEADTVNMVVGTYTFNFSVSLIQEDDSEVSFAHALDMTLEDALWCQKYPVIGQHQSAQGGRLIQ